MIFARLKDFLLLKLKDFAPKLKVSEIQLFLKPQNRRKKPVVKTCTYL